MHQDKPKRFARFMDTKFFFPSGGGESDLCQKSRYARVVLALQMDATIKSNIQKKKITFHTGFSLQLHFSLNFVKFAVKSKVS